MNRQQEIDLLVLRYWSKDELAKTVRRRLQHLEGTIRQRTRELRRSEERYRALFDHSLVMALTVDARGVITDANHEATATLEQLRAPLLGHLLTALFADPSRRTVERLLRAGSGTEHEVALADGRLADVTVSKVPGHSDAQVLLRDLTQWLELHREVHHTRRHVHAAQHPAGGAARARPPCSAMSTGSLGSSRISRPSPRRARRSRRRCGWLDWYVLRSSGPGPRCAA